LSDGGADKILDQDLATGDCSHVFQLRVYESGQMFNVS